MKKYKLRDAAPKSEGLRCVFRVRVVCLESAWPGNNIPSDEQYVGITCTYTEQRRGLLCCGGLQNQ